jgi:hypothetical protein
MEGRIRLTDEDRKSLLRVYRSGNGRRVEHRAQNLLLLADGPACRDVRRVVFCSFDLISECVQRFRAGGVPGVLDQDAPGLRLLPQSLVVPAAGRGAGRGNGREEKQGDRSSRSRATRTTRHSTVPDSFRNISTDGAGGSNGTSCRSTPPRRIPSRESGGGCTKRSLATTAARQSTSCSAKSKRGSKPKNTSAPGAWRSMPKRQHRSAAVLGWSYLDGAVPRR